MKPSDIPTRLPDGKGPRQRPSVIVPPDVLKIIQTTRERGLCLQALEKAQRVGALQLWMGHEARLEAAEIARGLGAPRLARWLILKVARKARRNLVLQTTWLEVLLQWRGPFAVWEGLQSLQTIQHFKDWPDPAKRTALLVKARMAARFRDISMAEDLLKQAEAVNADPVRILLERSHVHEHADRYAECLAVLQEAHQAAPNNGDVIRRLAFALRLNSQPEAAVEFLEKAVSNREEVPLFRELIELYVDLKQFEKAETALARLVEFSPILEAKRLRWIRDRQAITAYHLGKLAEAREFARDSKDPIIRNIAALPEIAGESRRIVLPVRFLRQHYVSCAPTTLAMISHYFDRPVDHVQIADEICYDGTSMPDQRAWAENHDWAVREFSVTWEATRRLIDTGIPFCLATSGIGMGHMQSVIGYDARLGTIIIRDPYYYFDREFAAEEFLARFRAFGPRGMVMVPLNQAAMLESLKLPDAEVYDLGYRFETALDRKDFSTAVTEFENLEAAYPAHRLTLAAKFRWCHYQEDFAGAHDAVNQLIAQFPEDAFWNLQRLEILGALHLYNDYDNEVLRLRQHPDLAWLIDRTENSRFLEDARDHRAAESLLRWTLRKCGESAGALSCLAHILWTRQEKEAACELMRFAASLEDKSTGLAMSYFRAAQSLGRADDALEMLRARFETFKHRSGQPGMALYQALRILAHDEQGQKILRQSMEARPLDTSLQQFCFLEHLNAGRLAEAEKVLESLRKHTTRVQALRFESALAERRADFPAALGLAYKIAEATPRDPYCRIDIANLIHVTAGERAAREYLKSACQEFPRHYELHEALLQLTGKAKREEAERERLIRLLMSIRPKEVKGHLRLALMLFDRGEYQEALALAKEARDIQPSSAGIHELIGRLHHQRDDLPAARDSFRRAISLSVDCEDAIHGLAQMSGTLMERRLDLNFIRTALEKDLGQGEGLIAFCRAAPGHLPEAEVLTVARNAHNTRPDLWMTWTNLIDLLIRHRGYEEAHLLATQGTIRFPMVGPLWSRLGSLNSARGNSLGAIEAAERALEIQPDSHRALRHLADLHESNGDLKKAEEILRQGMANIAPDSATHAAVAMLCLLGNRLDDAIEQLRLALAIHSTCGASWRLIGPLLSSNDGRKKTVTMLSKVSTDPLVQADVALTCHRIYRSRGQAKEAEHALKRALELNPCSVDAWDARAVNLARAGQFDQALAACRPEAFPQEIPIELEGRAAWIIARQGDTARALKLFHELLNRDPDFLFCWEQISLIHRQAGDLEKAIDAANRLVEEAPASPRAYRFRADLSFGMNLPDQALKDYYQAFNLDPTDLDTGRTLSRVLRTQGQNDEADQVLATVRYFNPEVGQIELDLVQATRNGDHTAALAAYERLASYSMAEPGVLLSATLLLTRLGQRESCHRALAKVIDASNLVNPDAGEVWVRMEGWAGRLADAGKVDRLFQSSTAGRGAIIASLEQLAQAKTGKFKVGRLQAFGLDSRYRSLRKQHEEWLLESARGWSVLVGAIGAFESVPKALHLIAKASSYPDIERADLLLPMLALMETGDPDRILPFIEFFQTLPDFRDEAAVALDILGGWELALAGRFNEGSAMIAGLRPGDFEPPFALAIEYIQLLWRYHRSPPDNHRTWICERLAAMVDRPYPEIAATVRQGYKIAFMRTLSFFSQMSGDKSILLMARRQIGFSGKIPDGW